MNRIMTVVVMSLTNGVVWPAYVMNLKYGLGAALEYGYSSSENPHPSSPKLWLQSYAEKNQPKIWLQLGLKSAQAIVANRLKTQSKLWLQMG